MENYVNLKYNILQLYKLPFNKFYKQHTWCNYWIRTMYSCPKRRDWNPRKSRQTTVSKILFGVLILTSHIMLNLGESNHPIISRRELILIAFSTVTKCGRTRKSQFTNIILELIPLRVRTTLNTNVTVYLVPLSAIILNNHLTSVMNMMG